MSYLGLDLGTSGVKALLVDDDETVLASATRALTVSRPRPGWSEQAPADWISATEAALDDLAARAPAALAAVAGVGLSGQMHGATLLGADDAPLRPCLLWNDGRSAAEAAALDADPAFRAQSGNIVFPGFTAPKLVWVQRHEPAIFDKIAKVLLPKDYLRLWLTGELASDMSDASGSSWLDVGARRWSPELLAKGGLRPDQTPPLFESPARAGGLRPALARRWGMAEGTPVAAGAGDNAASAIGVGAVREGDAFVSLGTSGVLLLANDSYRPAPENAVHTFCHALPGAWHQLGVILSAASALDWFAGVAGRSPGALTGELDAAAPTAPGETLFLPYLSGERTPHNDAQIRGVFAGLSHASARADMTRAVLEGVAYALRDNLEALRAAGGAPARFMAVGGGARSGYWLQMLAHVLGQPIARPAGGESGAAFGATRLGRLAATGEDPLTLCQKPAIADTFDPMPAAVTAYEGGYRRFRALYPLTRG